ncbi:leucine-rich single-pass membrane protein 1-like [Callorhinchus milii]|uniref:leucine-rich single-pass membrane protein 1-like n=1 Tax=Callorhinchus milii TaxID=7868 RepID=UPI00045752EC|nr:leucine-rich single-pass membrane protein 1-like [Callorhinchus milii]XP_007903318.1 leucine-rich single-pass membrane protein 1-like [Callorhinchus milii]|eukprot:gi/632973775/ref/XP_007903317.1/ PREDICTED: leucine-rich single-pass membrane protein 1-like [Callorhinchus milii]
MKMQNDFKELAQVDLDIEGKLYVVDSINNLHKANACQDPSNAFSKYGGGPAEAETVSTEEAQNSNRKATSDAAKSPGISPEPCFHRLRKRMLPCVMTVLLLVSFGLGALAIYLIVRMENQLDYILNKVDSEEKNIEKIKLLMLNHLNLSEETTATEGTSPAAALRP